jgi:predicted Rossmann fold nucleotide-binding protein DprA/Smf involved in DNA uptake
VLDLFDLAPPAAVESEIGAEAATVLAQLRDGPAGADELVRSTGLDAAAIAVALTELELAGLASEAGGVFRATSIAV